MQRNKKRRKNPIRTVYMVVFCMYGIVGKKGKKIQQITCYVQMSQTLKSTSFKIRI